MAFDNPLADEKLVTLLRRKDVPTSLGADCGGCPLHDALYCLGAPPTSVPVAQVWFVGEGPGRTEVARGQPMVGAPGTLFNDLLQSRWMRLDRSSVHVTNATLCLPEGHVSDAELRRSTENCNGRLVNELSGVPEGGLVITMGGRALQALTGRSSIKPWWGYPLPPRASMEFLAERKAIIFPTFHPAFVLRTPAYLPVLEISLQRALDMQRGLVKPWVWPRIEIEEGEPMAALLREMLDAPHVGVDVETAGKDPYLAPLLCIGLAHDNGAISVPWPPRDPEIQGLVREVLASRKVQKAFQNGNYDLISLKSWRVECSGNDFDTLIAHRLVAPMLPHDLQFIAMLEFAVEPWKALFKVFGDSKGNVKWSELGKDVNKFAELRRYNAKDALMTSKLVRPLIARLEGMAR